MHVRVGHFRSYGGGEPPEGRVSETIGVEVLGDDDELVVLVIAKPGKDGWTVQVDRNEEAGGFDVVDQGPDRVVLHVPRPASGPPADNVTPFRRHDG